MRRNKHDPADDFDGYILLTLIVVLAVVLWGKP